jgi:hypothetical protein
MRRLLILGLVLFAAVRSAEGCSCAGHAPFLAVARGSLVFDGVVRRYVSLSGGRAPHPVAMEVEIRRVLQGRYTAKTIRVIGDFGMSCVPYVSNFPLESEWVFAVSGPHAVAQLGDENFSFAPCSMAWARMHDGKAIVATGTFGEVKTPMSLDDLAKHILMSTAR